MNDFKKYCISRGITSSQMDYCEKEVVDSIENSLTPYILEEREMRAHQIDVFSRLLRDRILWVSGQVNDRMCDIIQAQLLYLNDVSDNDINMYINSPGGSVLHGLGIVDVMEYIKPDVATINCGLAASMGSILLTSGTKGKRNSLNMSRVMIHQVSSGAQGHIKDMFISQEEGLKYNYMLMKMLSMNTGQPLEKILEIAERDMWLNSEESKKFGCVDNVIYNNDRYRIDNLMDGYEDYKKSLDKKLEF